MTIIAILLLCAAAGMAGVIIWARSAIAAKEESASRFYADTVAECDRLRAQVGEMRTKLMQTNRLNGELELRLFDEKNKRDALAARMRAVVAA